MKFILFLLGLGWFSSYAAAPASPAKPPALDREAVAFVQDLLQQRPTKEFAIEGLFHLRQSNGRRAQVPVSYSVRLMDPGWESVYVTQTTASGGSEQLIVQHRENQPNQYQFTQITADGVGTNTVTLVGDQAIGIAFAGTDFWLSDLGLEFLHWPEQRLVRDAKITMKWGRPLKVLESVNPRPRPGTYSRVVSWIDSELGSLARADAYDMAGRRFKIFELKRFTKINGRWEVKQMEIRNDQADTRTNLEFTFDE